MATQWFYSKNNQQLGPIGSQQLKDLAADGTLSPTDLVWSERLTEWTPASRIKGFVFPAQRMPPPEIPALPIESVAEPSFDFVSISSVPSSTNKKVGGSRRIVKIVIGGAAVLFLVGGISRISNFGHDKNIALVKEGHLEVRPNITIGRAVENFMGNPRWESGVSKDGTPVVNVRGKVSFQDKPVEALLQFQVSKDSTTFKVHALEFNGIPQSHLVLVVFLRKMVDGN